MAVAAVTGSVTTAVWAADNTVGTGRGVALGTGSRASVNTEDSIAIGEEAKALYNQSIAIGKKSEVAGIAAVAIGSTAKAHAMNAIAIGTNAFTDENDSIAIGTNSKSDGSVSVAIGQNAFANGFAVAIGDNTSASLNKGVAIGTKAKAEKPQAIAIGSDVKADARSSVALGDQAATTGDVSMALGPLANASATSSVALGWESLADRAAGSIGYDPLTGQSSSLTSPAWKSVGGAVSVGKSGALTRQIINVAAGTEDTDAVNVAQLKNVATLAKNAGNVNLKFSGNVGTGTVNLAIQNFSITGDGNVTTTAAANGMIVGLSNDVKAKIDSITPVKYMSVNSTVTGAGSNIANDGATGTNSIAIGPKASATNTGAIALGKEASSNDQFAVAIGNLAKAPNQSTVAIGYKAESKVGPVYKDTGELNTEKPESGHSSVVIGGLANTQGSNATAVGYGAKALFQNSTALGRSSSAKNFDSLALGRSAVAKHDSGVALGAQSVTDRAAGEKLGYNPLTNSESTDESATWKSTFGAVSIGTAETSSKTANTRQITNVAAGSLDTDAVNVAQLKAAKVEMVKGSNISSIDTDVTAGYTKYTINAIDTVVKNGTATYNTDGTGTITLNTESNGVTGTVTVDGLQDKYITGAKLEGNTLTISRNDSETFTIENIATKADVTNAGDSLSSKLAQGFKIKGGTADSEGATIALDGDTAPEITFDVKEADKGLTITREGNVISYGIDATKLAETLGVDPTSLSQAGAWTIQGGGADKATISGAKKVNFVGGSFTKVDVTSTGEGAQVSIGLDDKATKAIENVNNFITTDENGNAKLNVVGDAETGVKVEAQADGSTKVSLEEKAQVGQVAIDGKDGKGEITGLTNTTWTSDKPETIKADRAATEGQLQGLAEHIAGDISKINTAINNNGKELTTEKATIGGNTIIDKDGITVKNPNGEGSTKITGDAITTGTVNADKVVVGGNTYISENGLNGGDKTITDVAPGVKGTDAVNMNQLNEVAQGVNNVGSAVNRLSNRVDKVAAGSAALAALHPLDFDSDDKLSFAVGFGGYKGEHAAALGAFYRANDDVMFSLGATVGNSNDQYNAGVSFRFGDSSPYTNMSKTEMATKLEKQNQEIEILKDRLAKLEALVVQK